MCVLLSASFEGCCSYDTDRVKLYMERLALSYEGELSVPSNSKQPDSVISGLTWINPKVRPSFALATRILTSGFIQDVYEAELDKMNIAMTADNHALHRDNKQLNALIKEYEQTLETVMSSFRNRAVRVLCFIPSHCTNTTAARGTRKGTGRHSRFRVTHPLPSRRGDHQTCDSHNGTIRILSSFI